MRTLTLKMDDADSWGIKTLTLKMDDADSWGIKTHGVLRCTTKVHNILEKHHKHANLNLAPQPHRAPRYANFNPKTRRRGHLGYDDVPQKSITF